MSMKRIQVVAEEHVDPSQWGDNNPLFLELGSEDRAEVRSETVGSEIPGTKATELTEALWVQTATMQVQACIKEQMCTQME